MSYFNKVLKPTKFKPSKRSIFGFDVETSNNNKHVYLISIYGENYQESFKDIPSFLQALNHKRFDNAWIVASNLHFDLFAIIWEQYDLKKVFRWQTRGSSSDLMYAKTYIVNGQFQSHRDKNSKNHHDKSITFVDTWNYDKCSVEKMGDLLHLPKLEKPKCITENREPTSEEWPFVIAYNLRDSEISYKYMKFLIDSFESLGATVKYTLAGTAMALFRNKYLKEEYWRHEEDVLIEQMKGYYGGRTEAFGRGSIKTYLQQKHFDKMNYYDFNSLYPSVMKGNIFPDPNSLHISYKNTLNYIKEYEGMSSVEIICPVDMKYPLLPFRQEDGLISFPTGTWKGTYCHHELRRASELGYKIEKVYKSFWYTKVCSPFDGYVNELYHMRKDLKVAGDRREKTVKLLLNSLYGKFGQRFIDREEIAHSDAITIEEMSKKPYVEKLADGFLRFSKIRTEPAVFCIPIWAAYITTYARLKLHDAMILYNPVYCDTDSLLTVSTVKPSNELGDLKLEYEITDGVIVRSKFYAFVGFENGKPVEQVKIKGLGVRLGYTECQKLLAITAGLNIDTKKRECECESPDLLHGTVRLCAKCGRVLHTKFTKFKEALRRNYTPNEIIEVTKGFGLEDSKHLWNKRFEINEWQESKPLIIGYKPDPIKATIEEIDLTGDSPKIHIRLNPTTPQINHRK